MYLILFEDYTVKRKLSITDDDKKACDEGVIDIIDIGGDVPKSYYKGNWHEVPLMS